MENSLSPSRRQVIAAAAATITLPMLGSALGALRSAQAAAPASAPTSAPAEKPGWITTTFKPADLKDNEFTAVPGHAIILSRSDKTVAALTAKCTHKGGPLTPKAGAKIITCPWHQGQFNLDGTVTNANENFLKTLGYTLDEIKGRHHSMFVEPTYRDSGGTDLGVALEQGLRMRREPGTMARHVLLITDAEVSDEGRILRLADEEWERAEHRRISVLCIDAAPNSFLATELAERGGGIARFLTSAPDEEDITTALDVVLADWSQPVYADLRLCVNRPEVIGIGSQDR